MIMWPQTQAVASETCWQGECSHMGAALLIYGPSPISIKEERT